MTRATPNNVPTRRRAVGEADLDRLVAKIAATRADGARYKLALQVLKRPKDTLLVELKAAFDRNPKARFIYPSVLNVLAQRRVAGVVEAVRPLLRDKDASVRGNAARLVSARGWGDDFVPELRAVVQSEAKRSSSAALVPALEALGAAKSEAAFGALTALAKLEFKNPWRRGNLLVALADKKRPEARAVFERALKSRTQHPYVRQAANVGLARLGDRRALDLLRADLEHEDKSLGTSASIELHRMLSTPIATAPSQLLRLAKWWDAHPSEIAARFTRFLAGKRGGQAKQRRG